MNCSNTKLKSLYWNDDLSISQVATLIGVDRSRIYKQMKDFDIPRRTLSESKKRKNPKLSLKLKKLYKEGKMKSFNKGKTLPEKTKRKMGESRKRLIQEGKIPRINPGSFKKGHLSWSKGKTKENSEWGRRQSNRMLTNNPMSNPEVVKKQLRALNLKPNRPEREMINLFKINNLPFHYVGNGQLIIGGKCPDFVCNPSKKVILLHGNYWHYLKQKKINPSLTRKQVEERDRNHYRKNFFDCLIIWDYELKGNFQVVNKIKRFMEN